MAPFVTGRAGDLASVKKAVEGGAALESKTPYGVEAGPQYELIAKNSVGEPLLATPALAGDLLIVRGAKHLFAIAESAKK